MTRPNACQDTTVGYCGDSEFALASWAAQNWIFNRRKMILVEILHMWSYNNSKCLSRFGTAVALVRFRAHQRTQSVLPMENTCHGKHLASVRLATKVLGVSWIIGHIGWLWDALCNDIYISTVGCAFGDHICGRARKALWAKTMTLGWNSWKEYNTVNANLA